MDSYSILWKTSAEHDLKRLDRQYIPKILDAIEALAGNPFPTQCKKLKGAESSYRIRIGDYRAVYQADTHVKTVTIYHIRHCREIYR